MKAYFHLLHYLCTWLRPVAWLMWLGAALLAGTLVAVLLQRNDAAFGLAIYAFVFLLALPYVLAWHPFRTMLASRQLARLPHFRLRLGLVLLVYTLLLSLYLPLASSLFWPGAVNLRWTVAIFLIASAFSFAMQWAVASPRAVLIFSLGPFVLLYTGAKILPVLLMAFTRDTSIAALALAAALCWALALRVMTSRAYFTPPRKAPLHVRDYAWDGRSDWLGVLVGNYRGQVKSAAGTVLLGYPDSLASRFFMTLNLLLISPILGGTALYLMGLNPELASSPGRFAGMLLYFSLAAGVFSAFGNGEVAARTRLLWLRQGGDRGTQWRGLEQRFAGDFAIFASIVLPITGVASMLPSISFDPIAYCLLALCGNLLGNYFSLAARLSRWSMFVQIVMAFTMLAGFTAGFLSAALPLPILVSLMPGLAVLFRQQAWLRFMAVDWHLLRPTSVPLKSKPS